MNLVILAGNLTDNPKMQVTPNGVPVCSFRIAVQRRFTGQGGSKEADFINIVAWRTLGEVCAKYLAKGRKCLVRGSMQTRSYDAKDGTKRYVTEIVADEVEFLSSPKEGQTTEPPAPPPSSPYTSHDAGFTEVDDDELPF